MPDHEELQMFILPQQSDIAIIYAFLRNVEINNSPQVDADVFLKQISADRNVDQKSCRNIDHNCRNPLHLKMDSFPDCKQHPHGVISKSSGSQKQNNCRMVPLSW